MIYPDEHNAPAGPVDMVWHAFILDTEQCASFSEKIWRDAAHIPPEVPEEDYR